MRPRLFLFLLALMLAAASCAEGYRFRAGVDVSVSSVKKDSTRTMQVTVSGPDSSK